MFACGLVGFVGEWEDYFLVWVYWFVGGGFMWVNHY